MKTLLFARAARAAVLAFAAAAFGAGVLSTPLPAQPATGTLSGRILN